MRVRFYIHSRKTVNGDRLIFCDYRHSSRVRFSTGVVINPKYWNDRKQRVKTSAPNSKEINLILDRIEHEIKAIAYDLILEKRNPTPDLVRKIYEEGQKSEMGIWEAWERFFYEYVKSSAKRSQTNYKQAAQRWKEFESYEMTSFDFEDMTESTFRRFIAFMGETGRHHNTTVGHVKKWKTFLDYVESNGWSSVPNSRRKVKAKYKKTNSGIYLLPEELDQLEEATFEFSRHEKIADLFLFQAETGFRYSDGQALGNQGETNEVVFQNVKSDKIQKRFFTDRARMIYEKYFGNIPEISNQKYNKYIKEAAEIAGLDRSVIYRKETVPLYKAITTHTARHTLADRLRREGVDLKVIQNILGHSSITTTMGYFHAGEEDERDAFKRL